MNDARARANLRSSAAFTPFDVPDGTETIHGRFERYAARQPDAIAIRLPSHDVSYSELNAAANRRARRLLASLGAPRLPVALLLHQGYESVAWTLAILKAGCCYAPLDQRLPQAVLRAMIDDLDPRAMLVDRRSVDLGRTLAADRCPVIDIATDIRGDEPTQADNLDRVVSCDGLAYIFCTSGSTGKPKGVADSHRNVLHNIFRYTNTLRFAADDRLSLVQNPSFSGTVSSLFGAVLNGASVVPFDLQGDGLSMLSEGIRRARVTVFHAVPSIFRQLSDSSNRFPDIRLIRLEGDRVTARDIQHFQSNFQDHCTLVNGLGATECGLVRQFFVDMQTRIAPGDVVPIGYAVPDVTVSIVDGHNQPAPAGSAGEIIVTSRYLATGYWKNPDLTTQRFEPAGNGLRHYRTGDLGQLQEDGCLIHLGRVDHRPRIAGEFVDVGEIERLLHDVHGVAEAVVHDFLDRAGERRLCAYVVRDRGSAVTADRLRDALSPHVARHALPATFMFLDGVPLTADLKVDRRRLPDPGRQRPELPNDYEAPTTGLEEQIARVWSEVLEIDSVGATDSLFALGGDSLRAARIVSRLHPAFGDRIRVTSLFEHPTIRALARALDQNQPGTRPAASPSVSPDHSIAVIGMACRFPGANTLDEFWSNLRAGRESIAPLTDVDGFDASLFGLTPLQAQMLDPQQRVWLECVYRALEDAGLPVDISAERTSANVGVFTGGRESSYLWHLVGGNRQAVEALLAGSTDDALELLNSNDRDSIATRTSFLFGLTGPSVTVQTACSTSLVAIAQACQALVSRQCDVAIAGGVAVTFPQQRGHRHIAGGIYSRDRHCRPFDADASGTVFSDGAGAVVLKRLDQAISGGDRIDAVIRGWAVNNDGSEKASFTAPNVDGQARVIAAAQEHAAVHADEISYVEAHGTATPVGDPIEFAALERTFRRDTRAKGFCGLGSVKSNIGHTDTAAGIAGFIKTVLALKHRELPATLHYRTPNPEIPLTDSPFYVVDRLRPWTAARGARIAGVTSLGVGGTNCHVVVEEAPTLEDPPAPVLPAHLVPISATSVDSMQVLENDFRAYLSNNLSADLASVAATAQQHRAHHPFRVALRQSATGAAPARWQNQSGRRTDPNIGFLFAGQGSQYAGMGRQLFEACPEFRRLMQQCDRFLRGHLDRPLLDMLFSDPGNPTWIRRTDVAQPALFALEYSLAGLLRAWGIQPRLVIGHSLGEYVAACVAGVFTLEEGLALAAARGRLMQRADGRGGMLAVAAASDRLTALLRPFGTDVSIAAVNSPTQTVLSGEVAVLERIGADLRSRGIASRRLPVAHAFHSAHIAPVLPQLAEAFARIDLKPPTLRLISNLYGRAVTHELTDRGYWIAHAREPVLFAAGIETLIQDGCDMLVEIGPDGMLSHLVHDIGTGRRLETVVTLQRGEHEWEALLETIARLYVGGARIDWTALQAGRIVRPVRLPTHPFKRTRCWYEGPSAAAAGSSPVTPISGHPLLGRRLRMPGSPEIRFEARFNRQAPQFLEDHRLFGVSLPPAASHLSMLAQAVGILSANRTTSADPFRFTALHLVRPLLLPDGTERDVQLIFRPASHGWSVELTSADAGDTGELDGDWTTHMIGQARALTAGERDVVVTRWDLEAIKGRCQRQVSGADFYTRIWANQGGTGSSFRWIESIWQGEREALCRAVCPAGVDPSAYRIHPGLIEAACQVLHCCGRIETVEQLEATGITYIPFSIDAFVLHDIPTPRSAAWCHARLRELTRENVVADLTVLTAAGQVIATLEGFCLRQIARDAVVGAMTAANRRDHDRLGDHLPVPDLSPARIPQDASEMTRYLQQKCAELFGQRDADIPTDVGFTALGLDSLAAMRLSNHVLRDFGRTVSLRQILTCNGIESLAAAIYDGDR
jgi:amino acid adenylation domain-containing protein